MPAARRAASPDATQPQRLPVASPGAPGGLLIVAATFLAGCRRRLLRPAPGTRRDHAGHRPPASTVRVLVNATPTGLGSSPETEPMAVGPVQDPLRAWMTPQAYGDLVAAIVAGPAAAVPATTQALWPCHSLGHFADAGACVYCGELTP